MECRDAYRNVPSDLKCAIAFVSRMQKATCQQIAGQHGADRSQHESNPAIDDVRMSITVSIVAASSSMKSGTSCNLRS